MGQPHKHAEFIKAKADGKNIQERRVIGEWHDMEEDDWIFDDNFEYRIKPEPPKYPQTKMTDQELTEFWCESQHGQYVEGCLRTVANAAIARAIEDGQVFTIENYVDAMKFCSEPMVPAAMLEKVGQAVADFCSWNIRDKDMDAIIAKVKEGK